MNAKLGLGAPQEGDAERVEALLRLMEADRVDYPIFWRRLTDAVAEGALAPGPGSRTGALRPGARPVPAARCLRRLGRRMADPRQIDGRDAALQRMRQANPRVVLRNHLAQLAIERAQAGDPSGVASFARRPAHPDADPAHPALTDFPPEWAGPALCIGCSSR